MEEIKTVQSQKEGTETLVSVRVNKTENMQEYKKQYYLKHKDHLNEIMMKEVECVCGFKTASCNLARHQKSKLHLKKFNLKNLQISSNL